MRKRAAFIGLLLLILAALCLGAPFAARAAHMPVLLFGAFRQDGDTFGGDLYLYDVHHQSTIRLTPTDQPNAERDAVMSPDWQQIALTAGSGPFSALGLMQFGEHWQLGNDFVSLLWNTEIDRWDSPAWSPQSDGNIMRLAFSTNVDREVDFREWHDFDIWVFDVPARRWQPADTTPPGYVQRTLPLGQAILGTARRLTRDDFNEYDLAWSPDGARMAFVSDRDGNFEIYMLDNGGINQNIRRITSDLAADRSPTWSPDGQWLAFASERDGNSEIYVVSADGGEPRRLTDNPARNVEPAWSPDGTRIAYLSDGMITLMRPDGSEIQPLFPGWSVSWMP